MEIVFEATDSQIKKALVTICVEEALLQIGKPVLNEVERALYSEFECFLPDCLDHPEYLKQVLENLYGQASLNIIKSIHKHLDEYSSPEPIQQFLTVISK